MLQCVFNIIYHLIFVEILKLWFYYSVLLFFQKSIYKTQTTELPNQRGLEITSKGGRWKTKVMYNGQKIHRTIDRNIFWQAIHASEATQFETVQIPATENEDTLRLFKFVGYKWFNRIGIYSKAIWSRAIKIMLCPGWSRLWFSLKTTLSIDLSSNSTAWV